MNRIMHRIGLATILVAAVAPLAAQVGAQATEPSLFSPTSLADASWATADTVMPLQPAPPAIASAAERSPAAVQIAAAVAEQPPAQAVVKESVATPVPTPLATVAPTPAPTAAPAAALPDLSEPSGPTLRRETTVVGEVVRIGDLVENAGAVAAVPIFRAPDLGQTGSVPAARVLDAIRPHHIIWLNTRGLDEVLVTRASRAIASKEIEARLLRALGGQPGLSDLKDPAASFDNEVRPIYIEPNAELSIARLAYDPRTRRFDVAFDLPTSTGRRAAMRVTGTLVETVAAAVPVRAIAAGDLLKASDVVVERRPKTEAAAVADVVGYAAKRALRVGEVIRAADVTKPELVGRNETVLISFEAPGMVLSLRGKALESGALGDVVNVLNTQSKRTLHATVSGPGRVTVTSAVPRLASNANTDAAAAPR